MKIDKSNKIIKIDGKETNYIITDTGDVFSLNYKNTGKTHKIKSRLDKDGYVIVTIYLNGKRYDRKVHILVATHFIKNSNPSKRKQVNHIDGSKTNNKVDNLEWVTDKENKQHAWKHGLIKSKSGEDSPSSIYSEKQVRKVCKLLERNKDTFKSISSKTNVSTAVVKAIYYRKLWKNISSDYDFSKFDCKEIKKTSSDDIIKICKLLERAELSMKDIAVKVNVSYKTVFRVLHRESGKKYSKYYDFSKYIKKVKNKCF